MALGWRKEYARYKEYFMNILALYKRRQDLKMFLEVLLSLGTVAFFIAFALKPTVLTITELYRDIQNKKDVVNKLNTKIGNLSLAKDVFAKEQTTINLTKTSIPTSPVPENYVRQIEALASQNNLTLMGISVGEVLLYGEAKKGSTQEEINPLPENALGVNISINVSGTYEQLFSFLAGIEKLRRPINVDSVNITQSKSDTGNKLIILVSGRVPFIK